MMAGRDRIAAFRPGPTRPDRRARVLDWILRGLLAMTFIAAGGAKLAGIPAMVAAFEEIGMGQWLRLVTGALEVTGGLLMLVPRLRALGAALLACVMIGALGTNLFLIDGSVIPPVVLLGLCVLVIVLSRRVSAAGLG